MRRFFRTTVVLLMASSLGCYSLTPIEGATPLPGSDVRLSLSDEGSVRMAPLIGPRIGAIDGRAMESSDTAIVLAVQAVVAQGGRSMAWSQERLAVPRNAVSSMRERTLNRGKTWLAAGLTVVGVFALGQIFGMGDGFDGLLGGGGNGGRK
ncbi:MAG TPA: hypothetical protein VNM36_10880, partial [Gemmatimonadaceae bacterium]|jgi:hypothetical protein|nr:hypothetical protein [Gemmatimonadaceae bacterium]